MILRKKQSKHGTGGRIMAEYIDREALYRFLDDQIDRETGNYTIGRNVGINIAKSALHNKELFPSADVAEVSRGKWIAETERTGTYSHCSECGCRCAGYTPNYKFCPNCGAKMDGDESHE